MKTQIALAVLFVLALVVVVACLTISVKYLM